jgi:hypothetical protein
VCYRTADNFLRLTLAVKVGGVYEVDPSIKSGINDPGAVLVVVVAEHTKIHSAKAEATHFDTSATEDGVLHFWISARGPMPGSRAWS